MTYKQSLFVSYYLGVSQGNATDAAGRAGYRLPHEQGRRLVRKSTIAEAIAARLAAVEMDQLGVLVRLSEIAKGDLTEILVVDKKTGEVKPDLRRARRLGYALKKLRSKGGDFEVELDSRLTALIKLGEYHNMWNRAKPPEISLIELARQLKAKLKEKHDRDRGPGNPG
jgi:phage terminase small subunit